jgi:hypothetical protein
MVMVLPFHFVVEIPQQPFLVVVTFWCALETDWVWNGAVVAIWYSRLDLRLAVALELKGGMFKSSEGMLLLVKAAVSLFSLEQVFRDQVVLLIFSPRTLVCQVSVDTSPLLLVVRLVVHLGLFFSLQVKLLMELLVLSVSLLGPEIIEMVDLLKCLLVRQQTLTQQADTSWSLAERVRVPELMLVEEEEELALSAVLLVVHPRKIVVEMFHWLVALRQEGLVEMFFFSLESDH